MAYDITVIIDDLPGALAQVGESLGNAGVNIGGYCSFTSRGQDPPPRSGGGHGSSPERAHARAALR